MAEKGLTWIFPMCERSHTARPISEPFCKLRRNDHASACADPMRSSLCALLQMPPTL